jgi:plasmid stabilization system protein ParE
MRVRWSAEAETLLDLWIDDLIEVDERLAKRARTEIRAAAGRLSTRSHIYRASLRWPGFQELPVSDWHKIIVYQVAPDEVIVAALFDMRQDLDALSPPTE